MPVTEQHKSFLRKRVGQRLKAQTKIHCWLQWLKITHCWKRQNLALVGLQHVASGPSQDRWTQASGGERAKQATLQGKAYADVK